MFVTSSWRGRKRRQMAKWTINMMTMMMMVAYQCIGIAMSPTVVTTTTIAAKVHHRSIGQLKDIICGCPLSMSSSNLHAHSLMLLLTLCRTFFGLHWPLNHRNAEMHVIHLFPNSIRMWQWGKRGINIDNLTLTYTFPLSFRTWLIIARVRYEYTQAESGRNRELILVHYSTII